MHEYKGYQSNDEFEVIQTSICSTADELITAIYSACERDPRGEEVSQVSAVCIGNKHVELSVFEFKDGTRAFVLSGA